MADEIDTSAAPEAGTVGEADTPASDTPETGGDQSGEVFYTNTGEVIPPEATAEETTSAVETAPIPLTPEQIEERAFQRTASWTGRELKTFSENLSENILRNVSQIIDQRLAQVSPAGSPAPDTFDAATFLDNPDAALRTIIPKILHEEINRQSTAEQGYNTALVQHVGQMMDTNPLFKDKQLGGEVLSELTQRMRNVDRSLPPQRIAKELISDSYMSVVSKRMAVGQNALAGNTPQKGIGGIGPPARRAGTAPPIKLDDQSKKVAAWFGNTDEDVRNMLRE